MMTKKPLILITTGEPAGIGPEICLDLANSKFNQDYNLVLLGDIELLGSRARLCNKAVKLVKVTKAELSGILPHTGQGELHVLHIPCPKPDCLKIPQVANASYVLAILDQACEICQEGLSNIMVTAPINKDIINQSGIKFMGHTEYLAHKFGIRKVIMMLSNPQLNVALLTTHLPLKKVMGEVNTANLNDTLTIINKSFAQNFGIKKPKIAVCGLNPHAGENGYLGDEEIKIINPVIKSWQQKGYPVFGSYSADTIFNRAKDFDVILAMYHDQGLPVVKYSDFEHGINTTLGLPIIRTSVDHGTALDIAGTGKASSVSLFSAVEFATQSYVQTI